MDSWHSYSKVWNIGHAQTEELFNDEVIIEEKVDGSQFSFGVFDGEVRVRSKGREFDVNAPDGLFVHACNTVQRIAPDLRDGWTYRGECLQKPKHNVLAYDRTPSGNIILFDIGTGDNRYLSREDKEEEAERLKLEVVPLLHQGMVAHANELFALLNTISCLGGQRIEGFVVKNYKRFDFTGKVLMGKHVSEAFREVHKKVGNVNGPIRQGDVVQELIKAYGREPRWQKAVQHLREVDALDTSPKDIGPLIKEVHRDIEEECAAEIKDILWSKFRKDVLRGVTRNLPGWYKEKLVEGAFGE